MSEQLNRREVLAEWRKHAASAYESGTEEKVGETTASEQEILDDLRYQELSSTGRFPREPAP
jgi:hypothetical protein